MDYDDIESYRDYREWAEDELDELREQIKKLTDTLERVRQFCLEDSCDEYCHFSDKLCLACSVLEVLDAPPNRDS